jgi:Dullard-like phosphatase family protein
MATQSSEDNSLGYPPVISCLPTETLETHATPRNDFQDALSLIRSLPEPTLDDIAQRMVLLGPKDKKYTLILDLDDSLVKSVEVNVEGEAGRETGISTKLRPHAKEMLQRLAVKYEIVVFTAGEQQYASNTVKLLDPEGRLVKRVLARENCIPMPGLGYMKDLRILADRDLKEMLIVDNSVLSFAFQLANGIPILAYDGETEDEELLTLANYLEMLFDQPDIVAANEQFIGLCSNSSSSQD